MTKTEANDYLRGMTVNIYADPLTHEKFEGAAKVKKIIAFDTEENTVRALVVFKQSNLRAERTIYLGKQS